MSFEEWWIVLHELKARAVKINKDYKSITIIVSSKVNPKKKK